MSRRPNHNRPICSGDQPSWRTTPLEYLDRILEKMQKYDTAFVKKIYLENKSAMWRKAAKMTLQERGVDGD